MDSAGPDDRAVNRAPVRRGVYILPSLFTLGTLIFGYVAILFTLKATQLLAAGASAGGVGAAFDTAAKMIGWAILSDGLDGRIARLTNAASEFGREFDSLADVIAFGVAPAFLAYAWGVQAIVPSTHPHLFELIVKAGWLVGFGFLICGAARLARFNIDKGASKDQKYFIGLPIPAAAGVVAAVVHWTKSPITGEFYSLAWLAAVAVGAFLMISRVRYYSFKGIDLRKKRSYLFIIVLGLIAWAIVVYSELALLVLATVYSLSGPALKLVGRFHSRPPASHPRESPGREVQVT